ncbi:hypothetical protein [Actinocrispum wychmicini]|uniref:NB-ARC domain-containing protein n=1 Tax=Actinocrispum wychmicini TaxID=1213861 RepID=A0A4R2JS77_9PSEU|nr:hypothetical protein [Actinocrispum wychmicini]TCO61937.1 hypothetical protein EV192_10274 [Actinocrispum wychmicini]
MTVMQQLPLPPAEFVDRTPLLAWMGERLAAASAVGRPACLALHGPAGVGVRSVVQEWYRRMAEWFSAGALRIPLGDAVSGGDALVSEALGDVLADLGVRRGDLPSSIESRKNLFRTRTHGKRFLVVLEEVSSAAQVEHFLLNSPTSAVVVISRSRIRRLDLMGFESKAVDPLEERFGLELFERVLGGGWFSAARVAPGSVARVCGGYPLAIRATAAQIASTPEWEVAELIRDLARRGLGALDPETQEYVRDSFDRAYVGLPEAQARAYRLVVGLYPGATVFVDAAAVMLDQSQHDVRTLLAALAAAQLLTRVSADVFEFHDVAHWHARDRAEADEPFAEHSVVVERVVRWYVEQTISRDRVLSDRPRIGPGYLAPDPTVVTREAALDWLEERRGNLLAVVTSAERFQLADVVWQMCEALWGVYHLHGHYEEWITSHRVGLEAATQLGDPRVRMRMASQLGSALFGVGDLDQAGEAFSESYRSAVEAGDATGAQSALEWEGKIETKRGNFDAAMRKFDASWKVAARDVPEHLRPRMFALLWLQRARTAFDAEQDIDGLQPARHAVEFFEGTDERDNLAKSLLVLGKILARLGDTAALATARRAADLFRLDRSARGEMEALEVIVDIAPEQDDLDRLRDLRRDLGEPDEEQ